MRRYEHCTLYSTDQCVDKNTEQINALIGTVLYLRIGLYLSMVYGPVESWSINEPPLGENSRQVYLHRGKLVTK